MTDGATGPSAPMLRIPMEQVVRLGVLILVLYLALALMHPFVGIVIWSTIFTVTMYPVFAWIRRRLGGRGVPAALAVTLLSLVLVIGPVAVLCTSLVGSLQELVKIVRTGAFAMPPLPDAMKTLPIVGDDLVSLWALGGDNLVAFVKTHAHTLMVPGEWLLAVIAGLAGIVLTLAAAVAASGFLFIPGPRLVRVANDMALRISGPHGERFVRLAATTIRNVGRGVVGISALVSLGLGLVFVAVGVPHAGVLTLAALLLSTMQLGAMYVAIPVAAWVWVTAVPLEAVLVTLAVVAICAFEHLAKPLVMGRGADTPTLVLFLGVLGGLAVYGLAGLFIGPVVLAVCYEVVTSWLGETAARPAQSGAPGIAPTPD